MTMSLYLVPSVEDHLARGQILLSLDLEDL